MLINMYYLNDRMIHTYLLLTIFAYLLDSNIVTGRKPVNIRDYIATDHFQAASTNDANISRKKPMKDYSQKEMIEILHNGQYFQDIFMEHLAPLKLQFGHVCENPQEWQQRFEKSDFDSNRYQGKVRWGNAKGDYGEHYWDFGHAGKK